MVEYLDDYEGGIDVDSDGFYDDFDEEDSFERDYEAIFSDDKDVELDTRDYERDAITGARAKKPKMSVLNKSKLSKQEMDELFMN